MLGLIALVFSWESDLI